MAREERHQRRRAFGTKPADRHWIEAFGSGAVKAAPLPDGAHRRLSPGQAIGLAGLAVVLALLIWLQRDAMLEGLHLLFFVGFMGQSAIKLVAAFTPRVSTAPPALPDDALPAYTVIVPLYREAAVAAELVANLARLDYPRDRLQVLIVLEVDDHETQAAFGALDLPAGFQVLVAPPGSPQTKPRACNVALERAHGDLVVIYDAEDAPHPGQLREAAARFAQADAGLACLQAPLRIEPDPRFLPDQFALEYAVLFEVFLPALARWGLPFPLGGTSNHFKASALRAVEGVGPVQCHRGRRYRLSPRRRRPSAGRPVPPDLRDRPDRLQGLEAPASTLDQGSSPDPGRPCPRPGRPHAARRRRPRPDLWPCRSSRPICTARSSPGWCCKAWARRSDCAQRSR